MDSALPMLLFLGFLLGFGLMVLVCSYQSREQDRTEEPPTLQELALQSVPRFFGQANAPRIANPVALVIDEAAAQRLELFLKEEMAMAEFSLGDLATEAQHPGDEETERSLFERLESYLRREQEAAANFVLNPSVESLYGPSGELAPVAV